MISTKRDLGGLHKRQESKEAPTPDSLLVSRPLFPPPQKPFHD
jgi:hypothetical protein